MVLRSLGTGFLLPQRVVVLPFALVCTMGVAYAGRNRLRCGLCCSIGALRISPLYIVAFYPF